MKDLSKRNIELESYMVQIGAKTLKYQPRVMNDPDPDPLGLGEIRCMIEGEVCLPLPCQLLLWLQLD